MSDLAILGGKKSVMSTIPPYNSIGPKEASTVFSVINGGSLSGYKAGSSGGHWCGKVEELTSRRLNVSHALATNSATSGLLAACAAVGVGPGKDVIVSPYTMSATAAAPKFLGANIIFADVDPFQFCIDPEDTADKITPNTIAVIATNLFGHPAQLRKLKDYLSPKGIFLIEDNAQAPFSTEHSRYAGTIGDIGVMSLNVHKHIQCGEGGICLTDNADFDKRMRAFINHAEVGNDFIGLNLRMTELCAAVSYEQIRRAEELIATRIKLASAIKGAISESPYISGGVTRYDCRHVFYVYPMIWDKKYSGISRDIFVAAMREEGVPLSTGYVKPLYHLPAFGGPDKHPYCGVAECLHNDEMILFEVCSYDPNKMQLAQIEDAFRKVLDCIPELRGFSCQTSSHAA